MRKILNLNFGIAAVLLLPVLAQAENAQLYNAKQPAQRTAPKTAGEPGLPWMDSDEFMRCGVRCAYMQAVEKISTKSVHTLETFQKIAAVPDDDKSAMSAIVPGFCDFRNDAGQKSAETVKECKIRWLKLQIPQLREDRVAIRMNNSAAADLQNGKYYIDLNGRPDGTPSEEAVKNVVMAAERDETLKKPIVTSMAKFDDIRDQAERTLKTDASLTKAKGKLLQQIQDLTKIPVEEFYQVHQILRDPDDKNGQKFTVVKTGPDGMPLIDWPKYRAAQTSRQTMYGLTDVEKARVMNNLNLIQDIQTAQLRGEGSEEAKKIYNKVRTVVLGAAKQGLVKEGWVPKSRPVASAQTPARNTASVQQAQKPGVAAPAPAAKQPSSPNMVSQGATANIDSRAGQEKGTDGEPDITVPAMQEGKAYPYFTVGYSDNTLGKEISDLDGALGHMTDPNQ